MSFKKKLSGLSARVKRVAGAALAVVLVAGSVVVGVSINAGAHMTTQEVLEEMLGAAKPYGLVAEEFTNSNHIQSNFAVNTLHIKDPYMGKWIKALGTTYVRDFDTTYSSSVQLEADAFNNFVTGSNYEYDAVEGRYYIIDSNMKRTGAVINAANCRDTLNVYYDRDYIDVTAALATVAQNFEEYAATSDEDADIVIGAEDSRVIDLSNFAGKQIVVVNLYANNYTDWQGNTVSEYYSQGGLEIVNKEDGQFVIINMLGGEDNTSFLRFSVNGQGTGGLSDADIADTVILNAVNVKGSITIGEVCGIVVAPYADVRLEYTCNGRVIAKTFENYNGEIHFVSEDIEEETTVAKSQEETEAAAEAKTESTTESVSETKATTTAAENETATTVSSNTDNNASTTAAKESETATTVSPETDNNASSTTAVSTEAETRSTASESDSDVKETTTAEEDNDSDVSETRTTAGDVENETQTAVSSDSDSNGGTTDKTKPTVALSEDDESETKPTAALSDSESKTDETETSDDNSDDSSSNSDSTKPSSDSDKKAAGASDSSSSGSSASGNGSNSDVSGSDASGSGSKTGTSASSDGSSTGTGLTSSSLTSSSGEDVPEVAADEEIVQTGDSSGLWVYVVVLVAAAAAIVAVLVYNRKKSDQ